MHWGLWTSSRGWISPSPKEPRESKVVRVTISKDGFCACSNCRESIRSNRIETEHVHTYMYIESRVKRRALKIGSPPNCPILLSSTTCSILGVHSDSKPISLVASQSRVPCHPSPCRKLKIMKRRIPNVKNILCKKMSGGLQPSLGSRTHALIAVRVVPGGIVYQKWKK